MFKKATRVTHYSETSLKWSITYSIYLTSLPRHAFIIYILMENFRFSDTKCKFFYTRANRFPVQHGHNCV